MHNASLTRTGQFSSERAVWPGCVVKVRHGVTRLVLAIVLVESRDKSCERWRYGSLIEADATGPWPSEQQRAVVWWTSVTPEVAAAARQLLSSASDVTNASPVAAHAEAVCQLLAQHFSRLIGELGMRTLFTRSLALAGAAFPCLRATKPTASDGPYESFRRCLEQEAPDAAMEAAVHVLQTFIQLVERFIGAGLVANLLHEVWPTIFPPASVKENK